MTEEEEITPQEFIKRAKMQVIEANKKWIIMLESNLKFIDDINPQDRLDYIFGIEVIVNSLMMSLQGWVKWLNFKNMRTFKMEDIKDIYEIMKELGKVWLQMDINITNQKTMEIGKELGMEPTEESTKDKKPSKEPKSRIYVA